MKYLLNWHIFDLSNNWLIRKKMDDCIIISDDKYYFNFHIRYYHDILFNSIYTDELNSINFDREFEDKMKTKIDALIKYSEYYITPIYFSNLLNIDANGYDCIISVGIFVLKDFRFINSSVDHDYFAHNFMSLIKYGIEPTNISVDELRSKHYPELKTELDDMLYIKQSGYYFNLFKSFYKSYKHSLNKIYIKLPIKNENDIYMIDIMEIFEIIYPNWQDWQIIWKTNKTAIMEYIKFKPWQTMSTITDSKTKKYRNIILNQSLIYDNDVLKLYIKSLNESDDSESINKLGHKMDKINIDSKKCKKHLIDTQSCLIKSFGKLNLRKKNYDRNKQLENYSKFTGSKHLHYLQKNKIKDKTLLEFINNLKICDNNPC